MAYKSNTSMSQILSAGHLRLRQIMSNCGKLLRYNAIVQQHLDSALRPHIRVASFSDNHLILYASSAAWVTRLRFQLPELKAALQQETELQDLIQIDCRVRTDTQATTPGQLKHRTTQKQPGPAKPAKKTKPNESLTSALQRHADDLNLSE